MKLDGVESRMLLAVDHETFRAEHFPAPYRPSRGFRRYTELLDGFRLQSVRFVNASPELPGLSAEVIRWFGDFIVLCLICSRYT